ncbi:hypothetical protein NXS19_003299 [Fusarium pseudograminearum]|nr:hypothetical protein NXS19_003299 [Fusarium pseudograminearum]
MRLCRRSRLLDARLRGSDRGCASAIGVTIARAQGQSRRPALVCCYFAFIRYRPVRFVFWLLTRRPTSNSSAGLSTAVLTSRRSPLTGSPGWRRGCAIAPL